MVIITQYFGKVSSGACRKTFSFVGMPFVLITIEIIILVKPFPLQYQPLGFGSRKDRKNSMNSRDFQLRSILITDDHSVIRSTLRDWLCEEFPDLVVHEASSGENALALLESIHDPDLVVMDFHLPGVTGIETTREIKAQHPQIPVIILTIQEDRQYVERAMDAGAEGYVIKRKMYSELLPAISSVLAGKVYSNIA